MSEQALAEDPGQAGIPSEAGGTILFDTLIASRPGRVTTRTWATGVTAVFLHVTLGGTLVWATTKHVSLRDQSLDEVPVEDFYISWGVGSGPAPGQGLLAENLVEEPPVTPTPEEIAAQLAEAAERPEAPLTAGSAGSETATRSRIDEILGLRLPGGAFPTPTTADDRPAAAGRDVVPGLGLETLNLERLTGVSPELALGSRFVGWPLIRNPTVVTQFISRGYNELGRGARDKVVVVVAVWVNENGRVEWAEVVQSSGESDLDRIALATFEDVVVFAPARREGERVSQSMVISVSFPF